MTRASRFAVKDKSTLTSDGFKMLTEITAI